MVAKDVVGQFPVKNRSVKDYIRNTVSEQQIAQRDQRTGIYAVCKCSGPDAGAINIGSNFLPVDKYITAPFNQVAVFSIVFCEIHINYVFKVKVPDTWPSQIL